MTGMIVSLPSVPPRHGRDIGSGLFSHNIFCWLVSYLPTGAFCMNFLYNSYVSYTYPVELPLQH